LRHAKIHPPPLFDIAAFPFIVAAVQRAAANCSCVDSKQADNTTGTHLLIRQGIWLTGVREALRSSGWSISLLISACFVVEILFRVHGIGYLVFSAVRELDYPVVEGVILVTAVFLLLVYFIVDIVCVTLNSKAQETKTKRDYQFGPYFEVLR
jgi:peptide/nickel transport system permease protein